MQANPSKFQAIVFGHKTKDDDICLNMNDDKVEATKCVKQLAVYIDEYFSFDEHISQLCIKVARQLNSVQRIVKYLSQNTKKIVFQWYKTLLESLGRELMYISRLKKLAFFVYKSLNDIGPGLKNDIFI